MDPDLLPPAVVFDCDGTLADTESIAERSWAAVLAEHGYEPTTADFEAIIGRPWPDCWGYFTDRADLGDEARFYAALRARFIALVDEDLELYDDALDTLRALASAGVQIAVASSSQHDHVVGVLERGGVRHLVTAVVGQDDVQRHKPDPEPYLEAARRLDVPPGRCVAVEDTAVGVASAVTAGMYTVGILRRATGPEVLSRAHRVVREVTVEMLIPPRSGGA